MLKEKALKIIGIYAKRLKEMDIPLKIMDSSLTPKSAKELLAHVHGILKLMEGFAAQGDHNRLFYWLGFVHGCFLSLGMYTLSDLEKHTRQ